MGHNKTIVYLLWMQDQDDEEIVLRGVFSTNEKAQDYADDHRLWWYAIEPWIMDEVRG